MNAKADAPLAQQRLQTPATFGSVAGEPEEHKHLWKPATRSAAYADLPGSRRPRAPRRASSACKTSTTTASSEEIHRRRRPRRHQTTHRQPHLLQDAAGRSSTLTYRMYRPEAGIPHPPAAEAAGGGEESHASAARRGGRTERIQKSPSRFL